MTQYDDKKVFDVEPIDQDDVHPRKKLTLIDRAKIRLSIVDWKKIGKTTLRVTEGVALFVGGFILGKKFGANSDEPIEVEGTVEDAPKDDEPVEEETIEVGNF